MLIRCIIISLAIAQFANAKVSFNNDIRPLLSNHCYRCHGPDENERKAGLRLDSFEGATKDNDGIKALVAGNIEDSELIYRIISEDPDEVMPPPKAGNKLSKDQIELIMPYTPKGIVRRDEIARTRDKTGREPYFLCSGPAILTETA